jgi:hypothetical protein
LSNAHDKCSEYPGRLSALREAYKKAMEDPELQMKAEKFERPVEPAYGDDVLKMGAGCDGPVA